MRVPPTPGFIAILCVVMAGFYAIDIYLARLQTREVDAEARALYARGQSLLEQGKPREAIDPLRKAHSQDRLNAHFALKLAQAQIGSGAAPDAQTILDEILARDSNDARANFLMARIAVADKRAVDADAYFHRAIYGKWPKDDELTGPERARLELAEYLAGRGEKRALLSEVLLLEHDPGMNRSFRIPELLMAAGAYPQAIVAYRSFIHENPQDPVAQEGLGRAELATGNYREARIAFARAQRERPSDAVLARQLELVDRVMSLDPTPRQLSSREKYDRSITLLTQVTGKAKDCFTREQPSGDVTAFLAEADRLPVQQTRGTPTNEMSEALLSLAERLWRGVPQHCRDHPTGEALPIIMQKVAQ